MYKIYWTSPTGAELSSVKTDMGEALAVAKYARDEGSTFVCMVSENPNLVGKQGVDEIKNGVLPDGTDYTWKKRRI